MEYFVDSWDPGYGAAVGFEEGIGETTARLVLDVEREAGAWGPVAAPDSASAPRVVLFVDGVRRIDSSVTVVESGASEHLGICASYAAGVVISTPEAAHVAEVTLRRGLFTTSASAQTITTRLGEYTAHVVRPSERQPVADALSLSLQNQLGIIELNSAAAARRTIPDGGDELLVIDGPIRARDHLPRTLGLIKSHRTRYLPEDLGRVVGALATAQRTPVFAVGTSWDRYTWYLRLPAAGGPPWHGIVRVECSSALSPAQAVQLAAVSQVVLPRFASQEHRDPRAPQNLVPIAGLERQLRHRLGDRELLVRSLRQAAA